MSDKLREEFEQYCHKEELGMTGSDCTGEYYNPVIEMLWHCWKSSRAKDKDAARYRCIKSIARVIECEEFEMDMLDGQDLDAMVDDCIEAMQCK